MNYFRCEKIIWSELFPHASRVKIWIRNQTKKWLLISDLRACVHQVRVLFIFCTNPVKFSLYAPCFSPVALRVRSVSSSLSLLSHRPNKNQEVGGTYNIHTVDNSGRETDPGSRWPRRYLWSNTEGFLSIVFGEPLWSKQSLDIHNEGMRKC